MSVVTQISILRLKEDDGTLIEKTMSAFRDARVFVQGKTGNSFYHFQEVEDLTRVYVLGEWESVEWHHQFLKENKSKAGSYGDVFGHDGMIHLDLRIKNVAIDAPILSVGRFAIPKVKRTEFTKVFEDKLRAMCQGFLTEGTLAYGWRQEDVADSDMDEFVMIAPWKDVKQHMDVASAPGAAGEDIFRSFFESVDTKHVKRVYF